MKEDRGITLVILVITIVLMLIIAGITITFSMDSVNHSRVVKFVAYMQIIQGKVDEIRSTNQDYTILGKSLSESGKTSKITNILNAAKSGGEIQTSAVDSSYRYFDKQELSSDLGIDNIEDEIVINFATREVVSLNGVKYESKTYYTQYLLPTGQSIITGTEAETRDLHFTINKSINGLEANITISDISITNGTLKYKEGSGNWTEITNNTTINKNESVTVTKSGVYTFMLVDNTDSANYHSVNDVNIVLVNPPVLTEGLTYVEEEYDYADGIENWAVAKDGTYEYIWVPRYAYKETSTGSKTIKFMKGTSSTITTYNDTIKDDDEWIIPSNFSNNAGNGYLESTGLWLKESEIDSLIRVWGTIPSELKVGDIVEYSPSSNYTSSQKYSASLAGCSGYFYTEDLGEWKVLSIDGNTIKIMPQGITSSSLTINGAKGWNNSITVLNDICASTYSNSISDKYVGLAKSLTVEDINEISGYKPTVGETYRLYNTGDDNVPNDYLTETYGVTIFDADAISKGYSSCLFPVTETYYGYRVETQDGFNTKFSGWIGGDEGYWLASRSVSITGEGQFGHFYVLYISNNNYVGNEQVFYSYPKSYSHSNYLRPLVTLTPKVDMVLEKTEGDINYWTFE